MLNLFQHPTGHAACLVYTLLNVYLASEVLKQVQHDLNYLIFYLHPSIPYK
jgi:hypothetical protein